ncbi:bifunctional 2-polyprenyl-6-hydroxyphenol methylase/3-demethylubiquinol 3-O-methyltransferase UbiG [Phaeobacter sp.]|uniref:class I SAM-dependent methyltransferase n=1 Tax=Phaeobacter sp. TaxID=1902409 RepID=UPI0025CB84EB|nr:class I SAM-dependent methyltransferase [Phaeobacter sp.]
MTGSSLTGTDRETLDVYAARAQDYVEQNERAMENDPQLAAFIAACPKGGKVLDLGCGPGVSSAVMAKAGLAPIAMDASDEMLKLAARHRGVTTLLASFDDIDGEDIYDGVWANFSLLHAPRAAFPGHLARIRRVLRSHAPFYIALKLGTGEARDPIGRLYTYYEEEELLQLLHAAGFTPQNTVHGESTGLDGTVAQWISVACHG